MLCGFFPNCFLFRFRFIVHARIDARSIHSFYSHRSSRDTETTYLFRRFCWFQSKYDRVRRRHAHRYENILSLFSSRGSRHRFPLPSFILFLRLLMCPLSIVNSLLYYIKREQHSQRRMVLGNLPGNVARTSELARDSRKTVRPTK